MLNRLARAQTPLTAAALLLLGGAFAAMHRLGDLKLHVVETIALGLAAGAVYLLALFALEKSHDTSRAFWLILAGALTFRALLLPLEPTLSDDVHRYVWDARVQQAGFNPYALRPDAPELAHLRDASWPRIPGRDIPTIYPPLTQLLFRATYALLPHPLAFKLPTLLADLFLLGLLAGWIRRTGGRNFVLALYAWNPLVVVEFAASGHFDAPAVALLMAACFVIIRGRGTLSTLLLTAAALVKVFPAALLPLWLRRAGWPRTARSWLNAAAALALVAVCAWPFRDAWRQLPASLAYYESRWSHNNASLYSLLHSLAGSHELAAGVGVGVVAGLAAWAAARRIDSMRAAFLVVGAVLLLSPNAFPWYFTWIVPLLCFYPSAAWLLLTVLQFLSYHVLIAFQASGAWRFEPFYLWLEYAPFFALLAWQLCRGEEPPAAAGR
jgi:type IV secretory pathway VirB2 component (pilin)